MNSTRLRRVALVILLAGLFLSLPAYAAPTLTVTPVSWNVVGLDSNSPTSGPRFFPVGTRICSSVATTNVAVNFVFDSANANVNLRAGSPSTITIPAIGAGQCSDAYFEIDVTQTAAAYDTTRRYHVTATDLSGTVSTATPRELYVEHLISQNRNSITGVQFGPNPLTLTPVASGGSMNLVVGNTYAIQLLGGTATQGYNQFEAFINFPATIFQVLSVATTYSADDSPYVPGPAPTVNDKLYADACLWQSDPNSPAYRSCIGGDFKAGGSNVVTTYTIKVISGGGTSQPLNTLLYDFSGSSYHYNADFTTGARIANIIDPTAVGITKSFSPNPAAINGISALKLTLTNPNGAPLGGYNVVDNLPANMVVANPNGATTSGCGTPTLTATAGSSSITFSNGTVAANGSCVITVNVTPTATGSLVNTTNHLFIDTIDTGKTGSATLTVNNAPPPGTGICGISLASWLFPTGFNTSTPAFSTKSVATATADAGSGVIPLSSTNTTPADGTQSWGSNGGIDNSGTTLDTTHHDYFEFAIDTTGQTSVTLTFSALHKTPNGPQGIAVYYGLTQPGVGAADPGTVALAPNATAIPSAATFFNFTTGAITTGLNPSGVTFFRIYAFNAGNQNSGSDLNLDDVVFTGCAAAVKPTISKVFAPNPIAVNGTSTLTFTLTNTNAAQLTAATFTDALPAGVQVAATPSASTTCGGGPTWAPGAGATSLTFGSPTGATIPASGNCTVSVHVTATTAGPHTNISGFPSTAESGTNTSSVATAPLTALLPPGIAKQFAPNPILAGGTSTLTFTITNPNPNDAIGGVAFGDTFPTSPGLMKVAAAPNATTVGCGGPTFSPAANAGSIAFSGATIAPGGTCTASVSVTAPTTGTYNNTSGNVSHIINAQTVNGNTASGSLVVNPPHPSIGLLKQVSLSSSGPWNTFLAVSNGGPVFYQFTIENTGDVPLLLPASTITDDTLNVSTCNAGFSGSTLPVAVAANNNHIVTCVVGPVTVTSGSHTNTAQATGTFNANPVNSKNSSATYATAALTLVKSATETQFTNTGDVLHYSYLVTNSGFAPLAAPVTVADNKTTVTCPPVNTVGDFDDFLDPGEAITCTATYTIVGADVSNAAVTNTASASAQGVTSPPASKTVPLSTSADVSLTKTLNTAGPYTVGESLTYTIVVANAGPATATNVQVTDTPTNLTITNVTGSGCAALPCTIASLASGTNTTITVTATIVAAGVFDNSATATATQPDPNPANNTDNTGNGGTTGASADVSLVKTLTTAGPYTFAESITYTLFVANAGPSTATNVQVTDTPTNLTITNVSGGGCAALPCTIASLASGANVTITVTATINAAGAFDNTATATATEFDPNTANNTDSTGNGGTAIASADVSMVKTLVTAGPYTNGESISYTLVVANAGPSTATTVQVTDATTNLTITNVSGSGCSALPCTIASIASGANTTINVTATITASGAFDNSATATAVESDPNLTNNTDNTGNGGTAAASADVSVVKTFLTQGPFRNQDSIQFNLAVANAGPDTATNVTVTDSPTGLTITNVSGSGCSSLPCNIGSLASGASVNITVTATINNSGPFQNQAAVSADQSDPNLPNNSSIASDVATTSADVSIVKTLTTVGPFTVGESISYTLVVHNAGPSPASSVQVTDTPTNMTITNVSGGGCSSLPCALTSPMSIGSTQTITVTATINAVGAFDNSASANGSDFDPNTSNNTDSTGNGGTAVASADVSLVKTLVTSGPFMVSQSISYTIVVANAGPSTATTIQVTDTPTNLTITNVSGSGCAALPCTIASLASGANTTINVTATINASGVFDNSATAMAVESDPNLANNTDNTGNGGTTGASADVSLVKTLVTSGPFTVSQAISYTIVIANAGPSTATSIQVTDTPTNLTITNVSGSGCAALPCTIASLATGANTTINVTATITAAGVFDNSATATAVEFDPNTANNTDNTGNGGSTSASSTDVAITKTASAPFVLAGHPITYTLVVVNHGPVTATGVVVSDALPTRFNLTNASSTQGSCSGTTTLSCSIGTMANGASVTITVQGLATSPGPLTNTATVSLNETDSVPANNTSTVSPIAVEDIPTTSGLGLILMALILVTAGALVMRRA